MPLLLAGMLLLGGAAQAQISAVWAYHDDQVNGNRIYPTNLIYNGDFEPGIQPPATFGTYYNGFSGTSSNCGSPYSPLPVQSSPVGWSLSGVTVANYSRIEQQNTNVISGSVPGNGTQWFYSGNGTEFDLGSTTPIVYDNNTGLFNMDANNTGIPNYPIVKPTVGRVPLLLSQSVTLVGGHTYELEFYESTEGAWQSGSCPHPVSLGMLGVSIGAQTLYFGSPNTYLAMGVGERYHFRFKALSSGTYTITFMSYGHYEPNISGNFQNALANAASYGVGLSETNEIILDDVILNDVTVNLSGKVYNDANGNTNSLVDGTLINAPGGQQLYAVLVNAANNQVYDAMAVDASGSYSFVAYQNTTYKVVLSTTNPTLGTFLGSSFIPTAPTGWNYTGEQLGTTTGSGFDTPQADGMYSPVTVNTTDVTNVDFGIQQSAPQMVNISGFVYDDANGMNDGIVNGTSISTASGQQLYAVLCSNGTVVATHAVAGGAYSFTNVSANTTYTVVLTTQNPVVGATCATPQLPSPWAYTGETTGVCNLIISQSYDGKAYALGQVNLTSSVGTGSQTVNAGTTNVACVNFGIEQPPVADNKTAASQVNPGGTTQVTVPTLTGSDPEDGVYNGTSGTNTIKITSLPANGTLYYNGTPVTAGQVIPNYNPSLLTVDPANGAVTVSFTYEEKDAAGQWSPDATVTMPFTAAATTVNVSGTVFDDANGLTDNTVNGTGMSSVSGQQLYAYLIDHTTGSPTNGTVIQGVSVNANGTYSFANVPANGTYQVRISTIYVAPSSYSSTGDVNPLLPSGWVNTGDNVGAGAGSDGTPDFALFFPVGTVDVPNVDFGADQPPVADNKTAASQTNPGGTTQVTVPTLTGSDPEDGVYNGTSGTNTIKITTLPASGTLYYNGTPVTAGQVIPNYNPSLLTVDPANGAVTVSFTYQEQDAAGQWSPDATVTMPFTAPLSISGIVYDDGNGMNDGFVNGTQISTASGQQLYAVLCSNGTVVATQAITGGTYSFTNVSANTIYTVVLTTQNPAVGASCATAQLPSPWVYTGETTGVCNLIINQSYDGKAYALGQVNLTSSVGTGSQTVNVVNTNVTCVNFGIEKPPVSQDKMWTVATTDFTLTQTIGGQTYKGIPASSAVLTGYNGTNGSLSGTDLEDCAATNSCSTGKTFVIQTINPNTAVYYNGSPVTAGQTIPNFDPTKLETYGAPGATSVSFTYSLVDANGLVSTPTTYQIDVTGGPLPVTLAGFAGKLTEGHAVLSWQTESEENFSHFEVQRSTDARQFEYAGVVKSKGSGSSYGFDAGVLTSPTMYYRLKLVDADGKFSYSKVVSVESGMNVLSVYPVPARDVLKIRTGGAGSYSLHDVLGRQVKQGSLESGENVIGLHGLVSGTYLLKVETDGQQQTRRIQVLK